MRFKAFFLTLVLVAAIPALSTGDVLYLKDGSSLRGTMIKFALDTLYFEASFGGEMVIPREKILRVELVEGALSPAVGIADRASDVPREPVAAKPGTLIVDFGETKVSSTISAHRGRDRAGHAWENAIEAIVYVDGERMVSVIDSTMDKKIMKGIEVLLRNHMKPGVLRVALDPGTYQVSVVLANTRIRKYGDRFVNAPLRRRLNVDDVEIRSGKSRRLNVEIKRKKFGLAGSVLRAKESTE